MRALPGAALAAAVITIAAVAPSTAGASTAGASTRPVAADRHDRAVAHPHGVSWESGVFGGDSGAGIYQRDRGFGRWRHSPIRVAGDYEDNVSWPAFAAAKRVIDTWGHQRRVRLSLALPMWSGALGNLRRAAGRGDDHWFRRLGHNLVQAGLGHTILRIGWEFNEPYQPWHVHDRRSARDYVRVWRQIVRAMRSVRGEHFRFDWCSYDARRGFRHLSWAYPGNAYVDYIGSDVYDWNQRGAGEGFHTRWHDLVHARSGLAWQSRFARRHHKPTSMPEWALVAPMVGAARGSGDDPRFVRHMWRWFRNSHVGYEDYFDVTSYLLVRYAIDAPHLFPRAAALYRWLWSGRLLRRRGSRAG